jgi:threonylcarbamoyladenosine tRNA methylthiotransferase MtaB
MDLMSGAPARLAPHLHAPLQSGSDAILKRMGRHWYTARRYRDCCELLARRMPIFGLGADVIVGFPGETEADHAATTDLIRDLPFTYLHVFPYSQRPGTASGRIGRPVDPRIVAARTAELRSIAAEKATAYRQRRKGDVADIVRLRRHKGRVHGLTEDYLDAQLSCDEPIGRRFRAIIADEVDGQLLAKVA